MVYDGYVKYEEAEIHRSAIMQDFRNSGKKKFKTKAAKLAKIKLTGSPYTRCNNSIQFGSHFEFFSVKFVMGYPCERHYILFYIYFPVILRTLWIQ